jgi:hypothetical protein
MPVGGTTVVGTVYAPQSIMPKPELRSGAGGVPVRRGREAGAGANPRAHSHRRAGPVQRELPSARTRLQLDASGGKIRSVGGPRPQTNRLTYAVVLLSAALVLAGAACCTLLWNSEPSGFSTHRRADTTAKSHRLGDASDASSANVVAGTWSGVPADADAPTRSGTLQGDALRKLGQSRMAPGAQASMNPAPPEPARSSVKPAPPEMDPRLPSVADHPSQPMPPRGLIHSRPSSADRARTTLVEFDHAPFPYSGRQSGSESPFLNVSEHGRRGHRTSRGRVFWEDKTYADQRVLLHIPAHFDPNRPAVMIVFFHGHGATLTRDVLARQQVPAQISDSGINAVLVAPQFALDAADSSPGKLWEPGAFAKFIAEAGTQLAKLYSHPGAEQKFANMPIVLIAYSGGYLPAALSLQRGGVKGRVRGVVLLDALYGELDKFAAWISGNPSAFFVSVYLPGTKNRNIELERLLAAREVPFSNSLKQDSLQNGVTFLSTKQVSHRDFVTHAYVEYPVKDLIGRLAEYRR